MPSRCAASTIRVFILSSPGRWNRSLNVSDNYLELVEVTYCNQTGTLSDSGEITPIRVPWNVVNNPLDFVVNFTIAAHGLTVFNDKDDNRITLFCTQGTVDKLRLRYMIGDFPYSSMDSEMKSVLRKLGNPGRKVLTDLLKPST